MIRNESTVMIPSNEDRPLEIIQDEIPAKPVPATPEWIGDPGVHAVVIGGRGII
jgi:hypothetical protein